MKMRKNNLDEMQEQELLKIEHNGCWLAFWLLLISQMIQLIVFGPGDFRIVAGEWIVFMILAVYLAAACVRRGIWDRHLKMNSRTNLISSLIAALVFGSINIATVFRQVHKPVGAAAAGLISGIIVFVLCFLVLSACMKMTRKKQQALEKEPEEEL